MILRLSVLSIFLSEINLIQHKTLAAKFQTTSNKSFPRTTTTNKPFLRPRQRCAPRSQKRWKYSLKNAYFNWSSVRGVDGKRSFSNSAAKLTHSGWSDSSGISSKKVSRGGSWSSSTSSMSFDDPDLSTWVDIQIRLDFFFRILFENWFYLNVVQGIRWSDWWFDLTFNFWPCVFKCLGQRCIHWS